VKNTAWLLLDKLLRLSIGLIVGTMVARYLGPEKFGLLSYVIALVALVGGMGSLGLDSIVVRNVVRDPSNASVELGTTLLLKSIGGGVSFAMAFLLVSLLRPDGGATAEIAALVGLATAVKGLDVARFWFEANINSKFTAISESVAFLISSGLKLALIQVGAPPAAFAGIMLIEALVALLVNSMFYHRSGRSIKSWRASCTSANALLRDCWPLALSSIVMIAYMKIDQLMLGQLSGYSRVGIYGAATRISEVWYLFPVMIGQSIYPVLIKQKQKDDDSFTLLIQKLMDAAVILSLTIALPVSLLSNQIINLLYGSNFDESSSVLIIHIWGSAFVFMGVIAGRWYLANDLQQLSLFRSLYGIATNVLLNIFLIPRYGANGAAISMVFSHFVGSYLANSFDSRTRGVFLIQTKAMIVPARMLYRALQLALSAGRGVRQR